MNAQELERIKEIILENVSSVKKVEIIEDDDNVEIQLFRLADIEGFQLPKVTYIKTTQENLSILTFGELIDAINAFMSEEDS